MEDILKGCKRVERQLLVVLYIDNIAVFGKMREYILSDTIEAVKRLFPTGFMINFKNIQLVETSKKV